MKSTIPLQGIPRERFSLTIENTLYTFYVTYNTRYEFWTLSLFINEVPLFENFKIVTGVNLGEIFHLPFSGVLYVESITFNEQDPTRINLGFDMQLIYDDLI